jgi:hypothetical protein
MLPLQTPGGYQHGADIAADELLIVALLPVRA